jgi:hypothetical protein
MTSVGGVRAAKPAVATSILAVTHFRMRRRPRQRMGSCVRTHATAKVGTVRFTGVPLQAWTASVMRLYGLLSIVQKARSAKFSDIYVMIGDTCYKLSVLSCS